MKENTKIHSTFINKVLGPQNSNPNLGQNKKGKYKFLTEVCLSLISCLTKSKKERLQKFLRSQNIFIHISRVFEIESKQIN